MLECLFQRKKVTAYTVFKNSSASGFWRCLSPDGFEHCFMLIPVYFPAQSLLAQRYVIKLEVSLGRLDVDIWWNTPEDAIRHVQNNGAHSILRLTTEPSYDRRLPIRGLISCVSVIKAVYGLENWRIITPYQLYENMLQNDAVKIWTKSCQSQKGRTPS